MEWAVPSLFLFPLSTFVVNLVGCFALGWFYETAKQRRISIHVRSGIATGMIGAFTTFSSLSLEMTELASRHVMLAELYGAVSVIGGISMVALGEWAALGWADRSLGDAEP